MFCKRNIICVKDDYISKFYWDENSNFVIKPEYIEEYRSSLYAQLNSLYACLKSTIDDIESMEQYSDNSLIGEMGNLKIKDIKLDNAITQLALLKIENQKLQKENQAYKSKMIKLSELLKCE